MGADASKLDGERAGFRYGPDTLYLWASQRVDALFAEDGQFYEAEIQGFDGDQIRVLFVEYGNEQMCGFDELRPMVDYQIGDEVEAKFAVDDQWYPAMVMDFDSEFKEYTVEFIDFKEEQICDRSFLRPLPDAVDQLVQIELKRQKSAEEETRSRSKTSVQKRLEAKQAELDKKQKVQDDDDEFGLPAPTVGMSKSPRKELTIADALASSEEEGPPAAVNRPPPPKINPFAAASEAAKKAIVNPIAAAAAALVAKKTAAKAVTEKAAPSKRDSAKVRDLFASDGEEPIETGDDPFVAPADDPFADAPLFSDGDQDEDDGNSLDESDASIAARFLAEKEEKKKAELESKEAEEQRLLREQMFSKIEDDIDWLSGEECEALWAQDGNWYKALVIAAEVDGTYTVEFTEYGDIQEATHPTEMRKIGDKKEAAVAEESTPSDEDMSTSSPSPLPVRVSNVTPPKVAVPALKLSSPAAVAAPVEPKLTMAKIEVSSSDEDDDEFEKEAKRAAKAAASKAPVKAAAPTKAVAAAKAPPTSLPPAPKKGLPPAAVPKRNTQAEEEERRKKVEEDERKQREAEEEERKRREAEEEEEERKRLEAEEEERKRREAEEDEEERKRLEAEEEEERNRLERERQLDDQMGETVELDPDFAEMAALLQPDDHHIPDGPPLNELEGLFEDDEFLDFLPDQHDIGVGGDGDMMGDEGDASQIFGIFDGDFGLGGNDGPAGAKDAFLRFSLNRDGLDAAEVVQDYIALREAAEIEPMGSEVDPRVVRKALRAAIEKQMDFKSPKLGIFRLLDKQSKRPDVLACGDTMAERLRVLVVGAGIGGLRVACELALLGVRVVVVEKRTTFSRNNVLHLWSHVVADVQALGAAFWVPGFCKGNIHHCAIRKMQLCLLRSALLLGVDVFLGCSFEGVERRRSQWRAKCDNVVISDYNFNVLIGADGESSKVAKYVGFDKKETAYSLALGITANFENSKTKSQLGTAEVNVARHFKQEWFAKLAREKGIELENMVYYKDDTHYFVCTAMKDSLLSKGVLKDDIPDLVSPANVNRAVLQTWCEEVASYAGLPKSASLVPIVRADGSVQPDTAIFDFSRKFRAVVPVRVFASSKDMTNDDLLWSFVIGDALMEPFWPLGTGANRAVLSAWDTMATLVQVGMLGLTTAEAVFQQERAIAPLVEAAMAMYAALQASDPNTMKPEKFKMPGEPSPLYSFDPNSRYPRMKASTIPEGEGEVIDWDQFVPGSSQVINTMSKADSEAKKRMSNPFIPRAIASGSSGSIPPVKGPAAKRVTSLAPMPKRAPAPAPVAVKVSAPTKALDRESVAPPSFAAPAIPPTKQAPSSAPPAEDEFSRLSMAAPAEAAPAPKPVKTGGSRAVSTPPPPRQAVPSAVAPPAASAVKKATSTNRGSELVKNPRNTIQQLTANDPALEVVDFSGNTTFVMKHRELCKELATALASNTVIKELHLKSLDLDKTDVQELCTGIIGHTSLAVLDLEKNKIDNDGAEILARALCQNTSIRELNLLGQARAFGDACLTSFVDLFDYNVTITKIIWRLDSRKSFAINKLLVRNNTIQKNISENRDVSSLLPAKCNLPKQKIQDSAVASSSQNNIEDDDDYCATVDLNVAIKPKTATASSRDSPALDSLEDDLYDEPLVQTEARVPAKASAPKPIPPKAAVAAPAPAVKKPAARPASDDDDVGDDDYLDTIDLNAIVPAKSRTGTVTDSAVVSAPKAPAPSSPRSNPQPRGVLPPAVTGGGRLRAMSGRGKAPNTAVLLATKLPPRKVASAVPLPARKSSTPPARDLVEAARSAVAEVIGTPVAIQAAPSSLPPAPVPPANPKKVAPAAPAPAPTASASNSPAAPPNAPAEVVQVYATLADINERYLRISTEGSDDIVTEQKELLAELAKVRDVMLPLHTKYKIAGYVVKAVAAWRTLNTAIPKLNT